MKQKTLIQIAFIAMIAIASCKKNGGPIPEDGNDDNPDKPKMSHITPSGKKLVKEDGSEFKMWGLNWGPSGQVLLEGQWATKTGWDDLAADFKYMSSIGANTVRLPLQYNYFMNSATQPNNTNLEILKKLVKVSEDNNLYLLVCGLNAFKKDLQPAWYTNMNEQERWATQAIFWEAVAGAVGKSPAILGYDLMNEPMLGNHAEKVWLPGESYGGFHFAQNITLNLNGRTEEQVLNSWMGKMTEAIRKKDSKHLITVGFLPYSKFANYSKNSLDALSTHIYPKSGEFAKDYTLIQQYQSTKPLIISETFPLNCYDSELRDFIKSQNQYVNGWIWIGGGRSIEELTPAQTIPDAMLVAALKMFKEMAPTQK